MKRAAFALALILASPVSAQAPVLSPAQEQICYAWLSLPAKQVGLRVYKQIKGSVPAKARPRLLRCVTGVAEAVQDQVRNICASGFAADAHINLLVRNGLDICLSQSVQGPPGEVLPDSFVTPAP